LSSIYLVADSGRKKLEIQLFVRLIKKIKQRIFYIYVITEGTTEKVHIFLLPVLYNLAKIGIKLKGFKNRKKYFDFFKLTNPA
jgi:hypothetical protein